LEGLVTDTCATSKTRWTGCGHGIVKAKRNAKMAAVAAAITISVKVACFMAPDQRAKFKEVLRNFKMLQRMEYVF